MKLQRKARGEAVGRVVGTERQPNTAFHFYFWAPKETPIGIGTLVVTEDERQILWGSVVEALGYNDLQAPLHDFIGSNAQPVDRAPTERPEIRIYKVAVLRREPDAPVQPASVGPVYLADEEDVTLALRIDKIPPERRIPIGLYESGTLLAPVYIDADFLLGPEAGHLNVTGTSGLAAKTSVIQFLLASIFAHCESKKVAAICFNVKGPDLMFMDMQPIEPTDEEGKRQLDRDCEWYQKLNIDRAPFQNVRYYAPFKRDGFNPATTRTHVDTLSNVEPLQWGLKDVMKYAEVMLNKEDIDVKADAVLQFIQQRGIEPGEFVFNEEEIRGGCPETMPMTSFQDLSNWFNTVLKYVERKNMSGWRSHASATLRKLYNRLQNLTMRYAGLLIESDQTHDLPFGEFEDRTVYVIDVAHLKGEAQDLVFSRVITELRERMETKQLGVDTLIVMVDELNQYAPQIGKESYVQRTLRDIAARGRYLGLVLFGAQQFRSQVDRQVVGNCSTAFWGQIEMEELTQPGYNVFDPAIKEKLGALSPGEMLVKHPYFQAPVFVKFPRPCLLRGRDGIEKFQPEPDQPIERAVWRQLQKLDPRLSPLEIADAVAGCDRETVIQAMMTTLFQQPGDPLRYFQTCLPKKAPTQSAPPKNYASLPALYPDSDPDERDPFGD